MKKKMSNIAFINLMYIMLPFILFINDTDASACRVATSCAACISVGPSCAWCAQRVSSLLPRFIVCPSLTLNVHEGKSTLPGSYIRDYFIWDGFPLTKRVDSTLLLG